MPSKRVNRRKEVIKKRAMQALNKPSQYGPDIDISRYLSEAKKIEMDLYGESTRRKMLSLGIDVESSASGRYYQVDKYVLEILSKHPGVEVLSLEEALDKHRDWIYDYYWNVVPVDMDKYTAIAELYDRTGYVVIVKDNVKVQYPMQICLLVRSSGTIQAPHNIIIVGRNSELNVVTGCGIIRSVSSIHAGVTEFYLGEGARVNYIMIHGWSRYQHVRPRSGAILKDKAQFINHYITFSPSKTLQSYPQVHLVGDNAFACQTSVLVGSKDENIDIGNAVFLKGKGSRGEIISRLLAKGSSKITSRAKIWGYGENSKGHIECTGMLLSDEADIQTIPELRAYTPNTRLTHEASIGKLAEDEIIYLMSKGFSREEAEGILIRGFMRIKPYGIPKQLEITLEQAIEIASRGM